MLFCNIELVRLFTGICNDLELAQFPVTMRGRGERVCKADPQTNLYLYQASSMGGGCNLARFGSPEPGL